MQSPKIDVGALQWQWFTKVGARCLLPKVCIDDDQCSYLNDVQLAITDLPGIAMCSAVNRGLFVQEVCDGKQGIRDLNNYIVQCVLASQSNQLIVESKASSEAVQFEVAIIII